MTDAFWDRLTEDAIRERLADAARLPTENPYPAALVQGQPQPAAVLIPLLRQNATWRVLFIRRTRPPNDPHGGQVAFPGGRMEPGEHDPVQVALREAEEEVGLPPHRVHVLGQLRPQRTITNYLVTPVVGVIPWPYAVRRAEAEVARVFTVPLAWLANPRHYEIRRRVLPDGATLPVVYFAPYDGEVIWGATARMVMRLLEALDGHPRLPAEA